MKDFKRAIFIFRRELRLEDNLGLLRALEASEEVVPVFIFDPNQIDQKKNPYFSERAFVFMLESLRDLDEALARRGQKLHVFEGEQHEVVDELIERESIDAVFVNKDYTPFARKRDGEIQKVCQKHEVYFERTDDIPLSDIENIATGEGKPYSVFTPFMKNASSAEPPKPRKNNFSNYGAIKGAKKIDSYKIPNKKKAPTGGREEVLKILEDLSLLKHYKDGRNIPSERGTTRLSAHLKFGTVSVREVYYAARELVGAQHQFVSELYWRDFYLHISYHFPHVFKESFLPWANNIAWVNDKKQFEAWKEGMTGVPIVDAGMRELASTGWMHNRARMIVASFLTKNLLIDWRWGEQYFATQLVDYDPSSNNGGWQWSASVGADPRPLRIFNPYTQAEKYDPDARYIKKWIPELEGVDEALLTNGKEIDFSEYAAYPAPLVSHKETYHRARELYKRAKDEYKT